MNIVAAFVIAAWGISAAQALAKQQTSTSISLIFVTGALVLAVAQIV